MGKILGLHYTLKFAAQGVQERRGIRLEQRMEIMHTDIQVRSNPW